MIELLENHNNIKESLDKIKNIIIEKNKSSEKFLNHSVEYLISTGGKMLRPLFVILSAGFGEEKDEEKILNLAAAIEMLHLATLIHDDIIDDSDLRRNMPTIQSKYSKEYAVYMGDYLFTQCFLLLNEYEFQRENVLRLAKAISKICTGEMKQNHMRYTINRSIKECLKIASGKTATLFAISFASGANAANADKKTIKILSKIGYNIGMAFQLIDDVLDYNGDSDVVGKDLNMDIINGYYTLPIVYGLKSKYGNEIEEVLNDFDFDNGDYYRLMKLLKKSNSITKTKKLAEKYSKRALEHIGELKNVKEKKILNELVPILLSRAL